MPVCERESTEESPAPSYEESQPSPVVRPANTPAPRPRRYFWGLAALAMLVCLAAGFIHRGNQGAPIRIQAMPFRFQAHQRQDFVLLTWNPNATAVRRATKATLSIQDGKHTEEVDLSIDTLRIGGVRYYPIFQDVAFRLTLADSSRQTVSELAHPAFQP